jgi:hypothetical protein
MKHRLSVVQPSPLPPVYAGWMGPLLAGHIPHEIEPTYDDCTMCARPGQAKVTSRCCMTRYC